MNKSKKKPSLGKFALIASIMILSFLYGFAMGKYLDDLVASGSFLPYLLIIAVFIASVYLQTIVHEAGHLVFGLISGYKFSSFRIFSLMWVRDRDSGKLRIKRFSLAGTGGQCLMAPPDTEDGSFPVILYNLGGSIMNVAFSVLCAVLAVILSGVYFLPLALFTVAVMGFMFAIMNGIPMQTDMITNDGYNALSLTRDPESRRAFWLQLKINELVSQGARLKDMPDEWFLVPSDEDMKNNHVAAVGVFACNRLMDEQRFDEADALMSHLLSAPGICISGIYRCLLTCDRVFLECIRDGRKTVADTMLTKEQRKFMQTMKTYPSVIRVEYAYALLCERDADKAARLLRDFETVAKRYPYESDIESERELIAIAYKRSRTVL